ncbi:helix-turn-helix domain-containing protein [bacterium]|nr:helix-turn-helix domain-containing protein [bacterium]
MNERNTNLFDLMSIKDFAKEIGKPQSTIYSWRKNGILPPNVFFNIGGSIFVRVNEFMKFMNGEAA